MGLSVSAAYQFTQTDLLGRYFRSAILTVTGLTANANNSVRHGLTVPSGAGQVAATPIKVWLEPTSNNQFWEYQTADSTYIYVGVGNGAGTSLQIHVLY